MILLIILSPHVQLIHGCGSNDFLLSAILSHPHPMKVTQSRGRQFIRPDADGKINYAEPSTEF